MFRNIMCEHLPEHMVSYCRSNNFSHNHENHKCKKTEVNLSSNFKVKTNFPFRSMHNFDNCIVHKS